MKRLTLAWMIACLTSWSALAQSKKVLRIDYGINTEISGDDGISDTQLRAWVNQDFMRISYTHDESHIEITDKKNYRSFILIPQNEEYLILNDGDKNDYTQIEIEYIKGQDKKIAGYTCQLAVLNLGTDEDTNEEIKLEVYYTEQIPNLFWSEFNFLHVLPGAPLSITVSGSGYVATKIEHEELPQELFEIPDHYTQMEVDSAEGFGDTQIADDRFAFTDETGERYGVRDQNGTIIVQPKYAFVAPYVGDISVVNNSSDKFGAINLRGQEVIPLQYDFLTYSEKDRKFLYGQQDKYGLLDENGKVLIKANYDMINFPEHGLMQFTKNNKSGYINEKEQVVVPAVHEYIMGRNQHYFISTQGQYYALYSIKDNKKIANGYDYMALPDEGTTFLAMKNGKYGFIDDKGKTTIPFKFTTAIAFSDGVAIVSEDEAGEDFYYINTKGEKIPALEAE
ncbi:WG repeat-containing protein [Sphingobacterium faecium]|uniref:WG repeat-containing protein n=1 Tax=Sphingobacterium faecium TaxID=34087 RepID=UPI0021B4E08A|nr:WG repeat-containing protein [Sphingobacterium faecium]UXD70759.1 WG repeat-containing protein [Sphingobacterium faecium]